MFWHFSQDPAPSRIMHETAPGVNEWVGRMWNAKGAKLGNGAFNIAPGQIPPFWGDLIDDVCKSYLPYLDANARAYALGQKRFDHSVDGYTYPGMQMSIFRVRCLEVLQTALASLTETERAQVRAILPGAAWQVLTTPLALPSDYDPKNIAPFAEPRKVSWATRLAFDFGGSTPHTRFRANDVRRRT